MEFLLKSGTVREVKYVAEKYGAARIWKQGIIVNETPSGVYVEDNNSLKVVGPIPKTEITLIK